MRMIFYTTIVSVTNSAWLFQAVFFNIDKAAFQCLDCPFGITFVREKKMK